MDIFVVSGFLGAGKTTFIQTLARRVGHNFVVYENEFGETGIDSRALKRDELSVVESTENCICCTGKADFANAVLTISNSLNPDHLVVEPSGAAQLGSLLETISRVCYEQIRLLRPITLIDGPAFAFQRAADPALWENQVRNARILVCTKTEKMLPEELNRLHALLTELNPTAEILTQDYNTMPDRWWNGLLKFPLPASSSSAEDDQAAALSRIEQITLRDAALPSPVHLFQLLDDLVLGYYGNILRAKGILSCGSQKLKFDLAGGIWSVTGCEPAEDPAVILIGIGLKQAGIRRRTGSHAKFSTESLLRRLPEQSRSIS